MQTTINQILAPFKARGIDAGAEKVGPYWQVWIGDHAGARKDGVALARELANRALRDRRPNQALDPEPEIMEIPAFLKSPEPPPVDPRIDLQAARIAELEAELDAARERAKAAESAPPADLADLIDWSAPPKERQEALLVKLREVAGLIGLAEDRGGRAPAELYARRDRLESGIHFNRPTLTETI